MKGLLEEDGELEGVDVDNVLEERRGRLSLLFVLTFRMSTSSAVLGAPWSVSSVKDGATRISLRSLRKRRMV